MDDYRVKVGADVSDYNSNIDSAKEATEKFQNSADGVNKTLNDIQKNGSRSAKELLNEMRNMEKGSRSVSNYRRQLMQLTRDIQDLSINYSMMSKEMQNSDVGRETVLKIRELTTEAGKYRDAIVDAQQSINSLASDTASWDAIKQGIGTISSSLQAVVSAGILGADSSEKLLKVLTKLKGIEAATNSVIQVGNALQKQSALMMGISRVQAAALAKAKAAEAVSIGKATVAQRIYNTVAKANPYLLLAGAILGVVAAVGSYIAINKKLKTSVDDVKTVQENFNKKIGEVKDSAGEVVGKFILLQQQYKKMQKTAEKQRWIKENSDKFKDLGLSIKDVNTADDVFIKNSDKVIKALRLRAEAEGLMTLYQEQYVDAYKKSRKISEGKRAAFAPATYIKSDWVKAGLKSGEDFTQAFQYSMNITGTAGGSVFSLTDAGVEKLQRYYESLGEQSLNSFVEGADGIIDKIQNLLTEANSLSSEISAFQNNDNNNNNNTPQKRLISELSLLKEKKQKLMDQLPYIKEETEEWREQLRQISELDDKIKGLEDRMDAYLKRLKTSNITIKKLPAIKGEIEYTPVIKDIRLNPKEISEYYQKALQLAAEITDYQRVGAITTKQAQDMIKNINEGLKTKGIMIPVYMDGSKLNDSIQRWVNDLDSVSSISEGVIGGINSVYESITGLNELLEESEDPWQRFFAVFSTGMNIFNELVNILETVGTITELVNKIKSGGIPEILAETAALKSNTAAKLENAGASAAEAVAGGASSVAKIPVVGWVLAGVAAVSLLATLIAAMSKAKKFAGGGIVGGNSIHGDKVMAALNSGEMVLNQKQQDKLWNMINSDKQNTQPVVNQKVELVVHGNDLVGVLNNIQRKNNKI